MPYDLWIRSTQSPATFEPERVPVPALGNEGHAATVCDFFRAAGALAHFEMVAVEVDVAGAIVAQPLGAADLNALAGVEPETTCPDCGFDVGAPFWSFDRCPQCRPGTAAQ